MIVLAASVLASAPAATQELAEDTRKDMWCGLAFTLVAEGAPGDATDEQKALAARFAEGGAMLTDRARATMLENGTSDESLEAYIAEQRTEIADAVDRGLRTPAYSFEDCMMLLPM